MGRLERFGNLKKNSLTSSGTKPATFRLVACLLILHGFENTAFLSMKQLLTHIGSVRNTSHCTDYENVAETFSFAYEILREIVTVHFRNTKVCIISRPPLWSSGQSSWLQILRPGFDSRHYQKKKVVGLERGPLSLVSTTEELLDRKVAAPV
jgi:hypothetical protein